MKTLRIHGRHTTVVDHGEGMPLVLLHGFPLDHAMWSAQIDALAPRFRVIAPDLRGFGGSEPTEGVVTMAQFADDAAAVLDALNIDRPVALAGLSMGGYIALEFFRRHRARLAALILCDTRAAADDAAAAAARLTTAEQVRREGMAALAAGVAAKLMAAATLSARPKLALAVHDAALAASPIGVAAAALGMGRRDDFTEALATIDCPTMLIVGECDAISPPAEMRGMAARIPGAKLVEIPAAGHLAPLENPAAVNAAIAEFLADK